jgi:hypothetical protein
MIAIKAFATHDAFVNNTPGGVLNIGELSTKSLTYAREKGYYKSTLFPESNVVTFTSNQDGVPYQLTSNLVDEIAKITKYIYYKTINAQGIVYRDEILQYLITTDALLCSSFDLGLIVNNGTYYIPEWISWTSNSLTAAGTPNTIKIWFSDISFQAQYDDYQIVVIPPFDTLDNFFTPASNVNTLLNTTTPFDMMARIQNAKNNYPETIVSAESFNYIDPNNPATVLSTVWNLLIYGNAGNNPDIIQNALTTYVLANSVNNAAAWTTLIPDLFKHNEFSIIPIWNQYAIPNRTLVSGIYSSVSNLTASLGKLITTLVNYPSPHITANADITFNPYKSLTLMVVGSPDNKGSHFKITDIFPDYLPIASTSSDFNRMSLATQNWSTMLATMITVAETMDNFSPIPAGMSKVTRNGILYLVSKYQLINYLVAAKISLP